MPVGDLYSRRPLALRRAVRALTPWPRTYRQLLGVVFLIVAVLMLRGLAAPLGAPGALGTLGAGLRTRIAGLDQRRLHAAFLLALFAVAFLASLPFTGTVRGGDDTRYLSAAMFGEKEWFFNRYAHVYLLKLFVSICGGNPLLGVRVWWSG